MNTHSLHSFSGALMCDFGNDKIYIYIYINYVIW